MEATQLVPKYYTPEQVARTLEITPELVRDMCRRGEFAGARKIGRYWRIPRHQVDPPQPE